MTEQISWWDTRIWKTCAYCGKPFHVPANRANTPRRFCNPTCGSRSHAKKKDRFA